MGIFLLVLLVIWAMAGVLLYIISLYHVQEISNILETKKSPKSIIQILIGTEVLGFILLSWVTNNWLFGTLGEPVYVNFVTMAFLLIVYTFFVGGVQSLTYKIIKYKVSKKDTHVALQEQV